MRNAECGMRNRKKLPSLFRRGAEALRGGVVVKKNQILFELPPRPPKRRPPLLNKEGSFVLPHSVGLIKHTQDGKQRASPNGRNRERALHTSRESQEMVDRRPALRGSSGLFGIFRSAKGPQRDVG